MKKTKPKLLFTERALPFVLEALGFAQDQEKYLTKNGERVIASDGKEIRTDEIGGFSRGAVHRDDLYSIMQLAG